MKSASLEDQEELKITIKLPKAECAKATLILLELHPAQLSYASKHSNSFCFYANGFNRYRLIRNYIMVVRLQPHQHLSVFVGEGPMGLILLETPNAD
jgi:hypothetical protein